MANGNPYMIDVGNPFSGAVEAYKKAESFSAQQERQERLAGLQSQVYQQEIQAGQAKAQREAQRQEQLAGFREFRNQEGYDELEAAKQFPLAVPEIQQWGQYRTELRERGGQKAAAKVYNLAKTGDREGLQKELEGNRQLIDTLGEQGLTVDRILEMDDDQISRLATGVYRQAGGNVEDLTGKKASPTYQMATGDLAGHVFNPQTGELSINPEIETYIQEKQDEANKKITAKNDKLKLSDQRGIQSDVTNMTKNASAIKSSANRLKALKEVGNPQAQLAMIFEYMKALDPTSVVRESEQGAVAAASGPAARFAGYYNQLVGEGRLPESVIDDMIISATALADEAVSSTDQSVRKMLNGYERMPESFKNKMIQRIPKTISGDMTQAEELKTLRDQVKQLQKQIQQPPPQQPPQAGAPAASQPVIPQQPGTPTPAAAPVTNWSDEQLMQGLNING